MKLEDFLKVKKVRCVDNGGLSHLTEGKEYEIKSIDYISVSDDGGDKTCADTDWFEPVTNLSKSQDEIDTTQNSVDNLADNTNILVDNESSLVDSSDNCQDACVKPKFKMGDKVYCPSLLDGSIYIVRKNYNYLNDGCELFVINDHEDCYDFEADGSNQYNNPIVYHATEENCKALQVLHPDINFEQPPKELTGSDLFRAMLEKGWEYVPCYVDYYSEEGALSNKMVALVSDVFSWKYLVPFNPCTGLPLTQSVLDE